MTNTVDDEHDDITFQEFCEEWLQEFTAADLPPFEKGQRFATKLVTQWLSVTEDDDDLVLCDGTGDGGIDIAYLHRADIDENEQEGQSAEGDTWYLIQSKYGTAFQGSETIIREGLKVIATLNGEHTRLAEPVRNLMARLDTFRQQASERDSITLVFATGQPISESDRQSLNHIRSYGREHFSNIFDVQDVSLQTIWEATESSQQETLLSLPIRGDFVDPSSGLRVGTVPLTDIFEFLKAYRDKTGNLDQLYEKNVRKFLGSRRKVNKGIEATLNDRPEMFGLYNNGITIVVSDFSNQTDKSCVLYDPYVVNGCQTTKTIWQVLTQKLDAGGTGSSELLENWRQRAERGVVVTKIVKSNSAEITEITRFTNSQNAVREQDFIALRDEFKTWANAMAVRHDIFLEIQRGGWEAQKAYQQSHPSSRQFSKPANALNLIKVYGAGWMREPGTAFGKNAPFTPGGTIFKRITSGDENPFDVDDLYAAYRLEQLADEYKFGRGADVSSRRQTRFLFYFIVLDFLKDTLIRANRGTSPSELTDALLALLQDVNRETLQMMTDSSLEVLAEYLNPDSEDSAYEEPTYQGDLNTFLKWEQLGKNENATPRFKSLIATHKHFFGRSHGEQPSPRQLVTQAITNRTRDRED